MNASRTPQWKSIALNIRALAIGVLVATVLVTGYTLAEATAAERAAGHSFLVPPESQALMALLYSPMVAVFLAACCAPVWLLLVKSRLDRWYAAAILGFLAVMTYWILDNIESGTAQSYCAAGLFTHFVEQLLDWRPGAQALAPEIHSEIPLSGIPKVLISPAAAQ